MSTKTTVSLEALTDLLQLYSANLKIVEANINEKDNTITFTLDGNDEFEGKEIGLTYMGCNADIHNTAYKQYFPDSVPIHNISFLNRLYEITIL